MIFSFSRDFEVMYKEHELVGITGQIREMVKFLVQREATEIDQLLFSRDFGFSVDQLMELAGHSVAWVTHHHFPTAKILVLCGPGSLL